MTQSAIAATPTKLRSGAWGARVRTADVSEGDVVTITTRAGKSWQARVTRVMWTGDDMAICATESLDRPGRSDTATSPVNDDCEYTAPPRRQRNGCTCGCDDCRPYCRCDAHCVCRGGNVYDC